MIRVLLRLVEMPWFYWTVQWLFWGYASLVHDLRVAGREHIPREGGVVVAVNHISTLDPPVMGSSMTREVSFMAKKELFEKPAPMLLFRGLHAFPVDRSRSDVGAIKEAMRRLKQGRAVGVFVQGTRNAGDVEALDGASFLAARAGVPILPAGIHREGRKIRVRFGEPFTVEGKGRPAIAAATLRTVRRINDLLPPGSRIHLREAAPVGDGGAPATGGPSTTAASPVPDGRSRAGSAPAEGSSSEAPRPAPGAAERPSTGPSTERRETGGSTSRDG